MYVIQIDPYDVRKRIWLDPNVRAPVYVVFSECPGVSRITLEFRSGAHVYERTE